MTEIKPELLPCPFCGGKATTYQRAEEDIFEIFCFNSDKDCLKVGIFYLPKEKAIKKWNTRRPLVKEGKANSDKCCDNGNFNDEHICQKQNPTPPASAECCKHEHSQVANDEMAQWCEICGACRIYKNGCLGDWQIPLQSQQRLVLPSKKDIYKALYPYFTGIYFVEKACSWNEQNQKYLEWVTNEASEAIHQLMKGEKC